MKTAPKYEIDENRYFDPDPIIREIAIELYQKVKDLPLICPHGHVDPEILAKNRPFLNPTELIVIPDHYIFRMLYSQGISLESLGIPLKNKSPVETDYQKIWQIFADHFYLFSGTPVAAWLNCEINQVFGVKLKLNKRNAMTIYDQIQRKLSSPEFLPRNLFDRFNIEVLTTTDDPTDDLVHHKEIQDSEWSGKVIPCFRPDDLINIQGKNWKKNMEKLSLISDMDITRFSDFIEALEKRRSFFKQMGAVSTDHGVTSPLTQELSSNDAETIFNRALRGETSESDSRLFTAHMLMEMARMSVEDGLVMQIHAGVYRNHNPLVFEKFGEDKGCDIPVAAEFTNNLRPLLNEYGNHPKFSLIVFTLDEATYSRELAPLASHYPAMKLGPPWWFNDSIEGMTRYRQHITETAGFYNTVGFNDDTRAFPSIPARHDLCRRMDSNFLAGLTARHIIDMEDACKINRALAYDLAKKSYKLDKT